MSEVNNKKLKNLLEQWPSGIVATSSWMKSLTISHQLVQRYLKSGWIEQIGHGAYKKNKDIVKWHGALASLQKQLSLSIHLGAATALTFQGTAHYFRFEKEIIFLFSSLSQKLPKWFANYDWGNPIKHVKTSFLPESLAIKEINCNGIEVKMSLRERAILECLYLSPTNFDLLECYQLMESLNTLRPEVMQNLLEQCNSIKVKRLFLYMAKKARLPLFQYLNLANIDLGKGDRSIVSGGVYNAEFRINISKELAEYV